MKNYQRCFFALCIALCLQLVACTNTPQQQTGAAAAANKPADSADTKPSAAVEEEKQVEVAVEIPTRPFPADSFYDLLVAEFAVRRSRYDLALGNYLQQSHQTRDPGVTARATRLAQFLSADKATLDAALLWVELEPDNLEAQYTAATILAKSKRPIEAMAHMTRVLEQGGKTNFAAIAASALPEPEPTRLLLEASLDEQLLKYPQHSQLLTAKALLLQQRDELELALTTIRQVLTLDQNELHAAIVEARLLQQLKRPEEAFVRLEQVVQNHPDNRRLRLHYARMLMSKDIKLAKEQFEILLSKAPNDADLLLSLALINKETDQLDDAKHYFERLLALGERTSEAHYYLGQLAEHNEDWNAAIEHYKTIPTGMDFLAAINRITTLYLKQGRVQTARDYVTELRSKHAEHAVRLYLIESEILLASEMLEEGNRLLTEALLIHPQQANLLYARSVFSEKRNNLALMEQDLRQIIQQDENNAVALNALGYVLANRTDRLEEAYQLISRALETKPDDPAIIDSLGWVEYRRGNLQQAHELLKKAYAAYPDHEVAAHLGEVLWALGRQQEAKKIWGQAFKTEPGSAQLDETVRRLTGLAPSALAADTPDETTGNAVNTQSREADATGSATKIKH